MNLWRNMKVQGALALFVAAACTQVAQAGIRPDNRSVGPRASTTAEHASVRPDDRAIGVRVGLATSASASQTDRYYGGGRTASSYGSLKSKSAPTSSLPSKRALEAMGDRWNAVAASYDSQSRALYSSAAHQRDFQQQLHRALGRLDYQPGTDVSSAGPATTGYVVGGQLIQPGENYQPGTDVSSAGPATTGYVVGGQLIQPGEAYQPAVTDVSAATPSAGQATTGYIVDGRLVQPGDGYTGSGIDVQQLHEVGNLHPIAMRPDDRAGIRGIGEQPSAVTAGDGFDWNDAGIGALGAFGIGLLLAGGAAFTVSRKHKPAVL